jgi:hypothetical protein
LAPSRPDARQILGRPSWDASPAPLYSLKPPPDSLNGYWRPVERRSLIVNAFETPERPLADGRDRPISISQTRVSGRLTI